jgi:hypothetical protein
VYVKTGLCVSCQDIECLVHTLVACPHSAHEKQPQSIDNERDNCAPGVTNYYKLGGGESFCSPLNTKKDR